jgi:hypothetical protein
MCLRAHTTTTTCSCGTTPHPPLSILYRRSCAPEERLQRRHGGVLAAYHDGQLGLARTDVAARDGRVYGGYVARRRGRRDLYRQRRLRGGHVDQDAALAQRRKRAGGPEEDLHRAP